ncbi:MAG: hypothetical protein JW797_03415 [Bradymonadales bacterium]|nr:hypothetical protein [Bradymonadales bacterium]
MPDDSRADPVCYAVIVDPGEGGAAGTEQAHQIFHRLADLDVARLLPAPAELAARLQHGPTTLVEGISRTRAQEIVDALRDLPLSTKLVRQTATRPAQSGPLRTTLPGWTRLELSSSDSDPAPTGLIPQPSASPIGETSDSAALPVTTGDPDTPPTPPGFIPTTSAPRTEGSSTDSRTPEVPSRKSSEPSRRPDPPPAEDPPVVLGWKELVPQPLQPSQNLFEPPWDDRPGVLPKPKLKVIDQAGQRLDNPIEPAVTRSPLLDVPQDLHPTEGQEPPTTGLADLRPRPQVDDVPLPADSGRSQLKLPASGALVDPSSSSPGKPVPIEELRPRPWLTVLLSLLAPGAGQMYLGKRGMAGTYAVTFWLLFPWVHSVVSARKQALDLGNGRLSPRRRPDLAGAIGFILLFWLVVSMLVVTNLSIHQRLTRHVQVADQPPIVLERPEVPDSTPPGAQVAMESEGSAHQPPAGLVEDLERRQQQVRALRLVLNARAACEAEDFRMCQLLSAQARELDPGLAEAIRLYHRATLALEPVPDAEHDQESPDGEGAQP